MCEDILRLQKSENFDWLVEKIWWHSATTSERGFWIILKKMKTLWGYKWARLHLCEVYDWLVKKRCEDILRLYLSEAFNWILKKLKTLWGYNWVRFWLYKLEDILRIQLREVFCRLVRKEFWIHSECTSERGVWTLLKNIEAILRLQLGNISD